MLKFIHFFYQPCFEESLKFLSCAVPQKYVVVSDSFRVISVIQFFCGVYI